MVKLSAPPDNHGHEFYAVEDLSPIATVCASDDWSTLRNGGHSAFHAVFPNCVHSLDVLLLTEAISTVTGNSECRLPELIDTVIGVEGLWGVDITPTVFVSAIASVPIANGDKLLKTWMEIHIREYESKSELSLVIPDWTSPRMHDSVTDLLTLARRAVDQNLTVVDIWSL